MINSQDFDRLSAYIDNQLTALERAELESRLTREPELQATLSDLQRTVRVLRLLPVVKPPRRFTLTPAMVGARGRREPLFPALRLSAAFCALLLAVVVAGDFAASGGLTGLASTARDSAPAPTVIVPSAAGGEAATASPEPILENYAASELAATETPEISVTPMMGVAAPQQSTPTPDGTDQRSQGTVSPTDKSADATATADVTEDALELAAVPPTATPAATAATTNDAFATEPPTVAPRTGGLGPLRVFEIVIAVLAVLLGLGAWFTRRS
jgi:anti-sigma factor RsiW